MSGKCVVWDYEEPWRGERTGIWNTGQFVYITNLFHSVMRREHDTRCRQLGLKNGESMTPTQRVEFDLDMVDKYGLDERTPPEVRWRLREWLYREATAKKCGHKK